MAEDDALAEAEDRGRDEPEDEPEDEEPDDDEWKPAATDGDDEPEPGCEAVATSGWSATCCTVVGWIEALSLAEEPPTARAAPVTSSATAAAASDGSRDRAQTAAPEML